MQARNTRSQKNNERFLVWRCKRNVGGHTCRWSRRDSTDQLGRVVVPSQLYRRSINSTPRRKDPAWPNLHEVPIKMNLKACTQHTVYGCKYTTIERYGLQKKWRPSALPNNQIRQEQSCGSTSERED